MFLSLVIKNPSNSLTVLIRYSEADRIAELDTRPNILVNPDLSRFH